MRIVSRPSAGVNLAALLDQVPDDLHHPSVIRRHMMMRGRSARSRCQAGHQAVSSRQISSAFNA